jgi:hypothetical protein
MLTAAFGLAVATIAGGNGGIGFMSGFIIGFLLSAGILAYPELRLAKSTPAENQRHTTTARCPVCDARLRVEATELSEESPRKPPDSVRPHAGAGELEWTPKSS